LFFTRSVTKATRRFSLFTSCCRSKLLGRSSNFCGVDEWIAFKIANHLLASATCLLPAERISRCLSPGRGLSLGLSLDLCPDPGLSLGISPGLFPRLSPGLSPDPGLSPGLCPGMFPSISPSIFEFASESVSESVPPGFVRRVIGQ
jgi:hypothetical protein